jgi:predicted Zn-dependent protease with MMP-like domain
MDDIEAIASSILDTLPEELVELCANLAIQIEDLPDEAIEQELNLEDSYELVALFRSGKQLAPGIESKVANDDDIMLIFRRPLLDMWAEMEEDLNILLRQVIIEELGQSFNFSESEIDEMTEQHFQGMF